MVQEIKMSVTWRSLIDKITIITQLTPMQRVPQFNRKRSPALTNSWNQES